MFNDVFNYASNITVKLPPAPETPLMEDQLVDAKYICDTKGFSDKWLYQLMQDGLFPKPIKLGRCSRWRKSQVDSWKKGFSNDN